MLDLFSNIIIPLIVLYIVIYGKRQKIDIYESFVKGAIDGLKSVWSILPYIIGILVFTQYNMLPTCCANITKNHICETACYYVSV